MNKFIRNIFPHEFFTNGAYWRALALASVFLVMVICQLFTFERFDEVIGGLDLPGGKTVTLALTALIPLLEVAALPYLLSMQLSRRWRRMSAGAGLTAAAIWVAIALWTNLSSQGVTENGGLLGATIPTIGGLWMLLVTAMLLWAMALVVRELPPRK